MSFARTYLDQLARVAAQAPLPAVRALHLPPVDPVNEERGEFCAVELADGSLGLSYVLFDDTLPRLHELAGRIALGGTDALQLANGYAGTDPLLRTIGFAAANAITTCFYRRAGFTPPDSADSIGEIDPQAGEEIGMIGFFKPLFKRIAETGASLIVLELRAELAGQHPECRVTLDPADLAPCAKVLSTSTILINQTLDAVLDQCRHAKQLALIGPSAGCLPDALFARGVTFLGGSWINDAGDFLDSLKTGCPSRGASRKVALTPASYPGFEALLGRLG